MSTKLSHRAPNFVTQYHPLLEMTCSSELYNLCFYFVEALVSTITGTWYENMFHIIVSVPPGVADKFLVLLWIIISWIIFLRICCVRKHLRLFINFTFFACNPGLKISPLKKFAIFLPIMMVYIFCLFKNLQYFCLQFWLINYTSWEFCNISSAYTDGL